MDYYRKIIDISKSLSHTTAVWPGCDPFRLELNRSYENDNIQDSNLHMNLHTGTHMDAPLHAIENSSSVEELSLHLLIGQAQVVDVRGHKKIDKEILNKACKGKPGNRLLLKTDYSKVPSNTFDEDFPALTFDAAEWVVEQKISVVGIDSPSIQLFSEDENKIHIKLLKSGIPILEHLALSEVNEGLYQLIALPLKIKGAEASPVRAVLLA